MGNSAGNCRYKLLMASPDTRELISFEMSARDDSHQPVYLSEEPKAVLRQRIDLDPAEKGADDFPVDTEGLPEEDFVDIGDLDPTAQALEQCEKWVLKPYRVVLKFLGWAPFTRDGDSATLWAFRILLICFWVGVILAACITQILACFRRDMFSPGNISHEIVGNENVSVISCREHLISSFVLLDILLLASYLFGIYLFSRGETEYLSNLASKVFIKSSQGRLGRWNWWLIGTIGAFFLVGLLWIILSFIVRILTAVSVRLFTTAIIEWRDDFRIQDEDRIGLVIFSLFGFIFFDMVYVSAVMNYAAQSEMNIYLLRAIRSLVMTKGYSELDAAIKDILECRQYLRVLNGKTATATALILFNLGSAGLVSMITLDEISGQSVKNERLSTVTAAFNTILWAGLVTFPFVQAARVTDAAQQLKATGAEIRSRPLQYMSTSQLELDSYLQLTQAVKLRATMFGIPIYPWMMYAVLVAFTFTMLILFQFGVYNFTLYL